MAADFSKKPLTRTQRANHYYMLDAMRRFEYDMHHTIAINFRVPQEWHEIAERRERKKTRICFSLDEDVLRWFRSMGPRYQPRMNDVLRGFMHAKLMGLLQGEDTLDQFREKGMMGRDMPQWGEMEERFAK